MNAKYEVKEVTNMQYIFKRLEKKYLITQNQAAQLKSTLAQHMKPDGFGTRPVQNLYCDTTNWDIIRTSIEKPYYKEKMRLRCYGIPSSSDLIFLELKKKYAGIVYKRRITVPLQTLLYRGLKDYLAGQTTQIARELNFHVQSKNVSEKMFVSYHRTAFIGIEDEDLRITLDSKICYRLNMLDFFHPGEGRHILPEDHVLMEIKTSKGVPMWLAKSLSDNKIYTSSFSKYGACYTDYYQRKIQKEVIISA